MGTLFVVATPIGNLQDITLRALSVLRAVDVVAAEDTRTTRALLTHHGIRNRLLSYNEHNMRSRTPQILAALEDGDVALVSEAGTPGVSDPGHQLIAATIEAGFSVVAIPGPSAVIAALVASGLPMREFTFLGFTPRRAGERLRAFKAVATYPRTLVFFESPLRLRETLADLRATLGDRRVAVCRELTKAFEEVFRGHLSAALEHFREPRGEFTIVLEGAHDNPPREADEDVRRKLQRLRDEGMLAKDAVKAVAASSGRPHREVYAAWLDLSRSSSRPATDN